MLAVGFPIWLWTAGPRTLNATETSSGVTFNLTARWRSTTFAMGDGRTVTCTSMTQYNHSVKPGTASPNCGHVYTKPSLPKGSYTVRATTIGTSPGPPWVTAGCCLPRIQATVRYRLGNCPL